MLLQRPIVLVLAVIGVYFAIATLATALMPRPHTTFEYLVSGALATVVCLILGFVLYLKSRPGRRRT